MTEFNDMEAMEIPDEMLEDIAGGVLNANQQAQILKQVRDAKAAGIAPRQFIASHQSWSGEYKKYALDNWANA